MRRGLAFCTALLLVGVACGGGEGPTGSDGPVQVKVGLLLTLSGLGGDLAQAALGSATLAAEDGEARGVEIKVVDADYGGNPKRAVALAERLAQEGVTGIVVASDDPGLVQALQGFENVPLVWSLVADDAAVSPESSHFRTAPSNALQAEVLARFLTEDRGYQLVSVVADSTPFGQQGADIFDRFLQDFGAENVLRWNFKKGGDLSTAVTAAGGLNAQAMVVWTEDTAEAARITIEAHRTRQSYQLALSGNLATFRFGKNAASQVAPTAFTEGILSVGTWAGPWFELPRMIGFYERFQDANDALAPFQAVQIYDAVLLLGEAARRAESTAPSDVVQAIEEIQNFAGAGVPMTFGTIDHEGIDEEDMAIWAFTKDQDAAGGEFAPDVATEGGFFTIVTRTAQLPPELSYLLEGLPQ